MGNQASVSLTISACEKDRHRHAAMPTSHTVARESPRSRVLSVLFPGRSDRLRNDLRSCPAQPLDAFYCYRPESGSDCRLIRIEHGAASALGPGCGCFAFSARVPIAAAHESCPAAEQHRSGAVRQQHAHVASAPLLVPPSLRMAVRFRVADASAWRRVQDNAAAGIMRRRLRSNENGGGHR